MNLFAILKQRRYLLGDIHNSPVMEDFVPDNNHKARSEKFVFFLLH
jgi:hypothetical protein